MAVILRIEQVMARVKKSRSGIYADVKSGTFPHPVKIGIRAIGWTESSVEQWIQERIERSAKEQAAHA